MVLSATAGRRRRRPRVARLTKPALWVACLAPLVWLAAQWAMGGGGLGANPIEATTRFLGLWALHLLLATLAVTPAREILGWSWLAPLRRPLGLFAFLYACLHLASYAALDVFFAWDEIAADIAKRAYITCGLAAFTLLLPLAATSPAAVIRRLGAARWRRLHSLVYAAAVLACLHYAMMVKADLGPPLAYAAILAALLGYRLWRRLGGRAAPAAAAPGLSPRGG